MHWLALHCAGLPLAVFAGPDIATAVVIEWSGGRERIVAAGIRAREAGIDPGMSLGAARIRRPDLSVLVRDRSAEESALQRLAGECLRFTDHVAPEPPLDLLLEIGRSRHLFGGLDPLLAGIDNLLDRRGYAAARGLAPTPAAARLLARAGGGLVDSGESLAEVLADLPAGLVAPDADTAKRLTGWGIDRLGECLALPRAGLARRLGPAFVAALDRITGQQPETVPRFTPSDRFSARLALPQETRSLDSVLAAVDILCGELAEWLRARDAAIHGFTLELHPERNADPCTAVHVGLVTPGREAGHLLTLARERLERTGLQAPVSAVSLQGEAAVGYAPPPADFWAGGDGEPPERLLERLRARLGRRAVSGITLCADHRPERAWAWSEPGQAPLREPVTAPTRPLWLLAEPVALATGEGHYPLLGAGALEMLAGPERIETGWWDGGNVERDYFIARSRIGLVLWIYRQRRLPGRWFVHGLFG